MDKKTAQILIENTFNDSFNEERFMIFVKNLLNDLEPKSNFYKGNLVWDDYKEHINTYKRIGKYIDPEGEALDVLIVEVKSVAKLERARTALRNFVIKHLSKFGKDFALVAFYSKEDEGADWRFSFIKLEYRSEIDERKGKVKTKKEFTPAKRYSFLVGKYEKAHTAKNQLLPLLKNISNNPTFEELEAAFSIEKVTDEFFQQYKDLYIKLFEHFEKDSRVKAELDKAGIDNARFTKKLLGQIVFLYFLQKKGWLGIAQNDRWGTGKKRFIQDLFEQAQKEKVNFFKDKLQYLFYEALAKERDNVNSYYERFDCRIPFLNGGLFEANYNWRSANIAIPEALFRNEEKNRSGDIGTGALDVFDRYNFTIKEDEPLDKEVAVDPEMLGKVFENMLDISERKFNGAFYTPREIVHYMCQESLIHYLFNTLEGKVDKTAFETFIHEGHFALENDERVAAKGESKTYKYQLPEIIRQHADLIDQKLSDIRICDPAIGSGAFPVGLLHELVNAMLVLKPHLSYDYLTKKLKGFGFEHRESVNDSRYIYRLKRHIIQESIYGVDIDASAIDIARLRLWLSLVVDEDDLDPIETLPNLDYKIVCGNSLVGLPDTAMKSYKVEEELETLKEKFYDITDEKEKKALRQQINSKIRELLDSAEQFAGYNIDFDFKLFFSEVWREKGGFDVVIGNPPYDVYQGNKNDELEVLKSIPLFNNAKGRKLNAFELFLCLTPTLLSREGFQSLIFQNSFLADTSSKLLRKYYFDHLDIVSIDSFPERDDIRRRVFESAKMSVCILQTFNRQVPDNTFVLRIWKERWMETSTAINIKASDILKLDAEYYSIPSISKDEYLILKRFQKFKKIKNIGHCYEGEINLTTCKPYLSEDNNVGFYRMIKGASVQKWFIKEKMSQGKNEFLSPDYIIGKSAKSKAFHYKHSRLVLQGITGVDEKYRLKVAVLNEGVFCGNSANYILFDNNKQNIYSVACYLNSEVPNWFFKCYSTNSNVNGYEVDNLPIPHNFPLSLDSIYKYLNFISILDFDLISLNFFLEVVNSIVYELFFPEEIKSAGKEILKHLGNLKPLNDEMSDEEKLAIIQSEFERLYDPNHPVRFAIETLDSVEEIRIIKEALK
ncbi:Eco57I restriction-modification methylase domain-containing protein [Geofilum rubicundum]|uniref:site-specific DNA-methyltransferase (adenine-specific) n=1 Tax=Geofilum rubicundum JCM 15548 TaxID=1236989 RepID=A0A0E9LSQ9_9BACT|nr:Eco57I restriction-modification methylase domain-containing protein [Geofilum rubicundum]GAO28333.1 putative type IIS restriction /modification enzyme, N-terminal half [Geofilum rubicundum JCM 15548]